MSIDQIKALIIYKFCETKKNEGDLKLNERSSDSPNSNHSETGQRGPRALTLEQRIEESLHTKEKFQKLTLLRK